MVEPTGFEPATFSLRTRTGFVPPSGPTWPHVDSLLISNGLSLLEVDPHGPTWPHFLSSVWILFGSCLERHPSQASLDRSLDGSNASVTLAKLSKAALVLGHKLRVELRPRITEMVPGAGWVGSCLCGACR